MLTTSWSYRIQTIVWTIAILLIGGSLLAEEKKFYTKMYVNDELKQFWNKHWYYGGGSKDKPTDPMGKYCGPWLEVDYSGNGPLPAPVVLNVPLGETFPIGKAYQVFVRNYYNGKMEVTVGDITREIEITKASPENWTKCGLFEPNAPFDHVVLTYHPTTLLKDSGVKQNWRAFVLGFYIGTETQKMPRKAGEIVELLPEDKPVALKGNYLENASFEAGLGGWGKIFGTTYVFTADNLDDTTAADGRYSLKMSTAQAAQNSASQFKEFGFETKLIRLPPERSYTVSFFAKSNKPAVLKLEMNGLREDLGHFKGIPALTKDAALESEWKRFSYTGKVPPAPGCLYTLRFRVELKTASNVWLDAIQLEEGEAPSEFKTRENLQVGYISRTLGNIFYDQEPSQADVLIYNPKDLKAATLTYTITDYWHHEVAQGERKLALDGKKNDTFSLPLYAAKKGIYRVLLKAEDSVGEMIYSVLPPNSWLDKKNPEGSLGGEALFGPYHLAVLKRANFSWVVSKGIARWVVVEPEQGRFKFDDAAVQAAEANQLMVLLQPIPGLPYQVQKSWFKDLSKPEGGKLWAVEKKAEYIKCWSEFIYNLVNHFKGSVKYWEIDNEPNWEYSGAEYAEILKAGIEGVKKADLTAKIVGFSGGGFSEKFFNEVAVDTDMSQVDYVSVHFYGNETRDMLKCAEFRKKYNKPGWNTETGRSCPSFFSTLVRYDQFILPNYWDEVKDAIRERTIFTAKNYLLTLSVAGCERYFYYTTRFNNSGPSEPTWKLAAMDLMEYDGGLRSNGVALSIASQFLDGAKYQGQVAGHEQLETFLFRKGTGSVGFFWAKPGATAKISRPAEECLAFFDIMGNVVEGDVLGVDDSPIYFTSSAGVEKVESILKAMK